MRHALAILSFPTDGARLYEITGEVAGWLGETGIDRGVLTLLCQHTSASLLVTENVSGSVHRDLVRWLAKAAPDGGDYEHSAEGPDDMPAHVKAMLTGVTLTLPVADGRMLLGAWQGLFLAEHRRAPHRRSVAVHMLGD
jgi:secondary thiamine-phosphate synthase enzyme